MKRDDALLLDMLLAAQDAMQFSEGLTFAAFERSEITQQAIIRAVETVGRAASGVGAETVERHPEIPWADVVEMQHCFTDERFRINLPRLWDTVERDIPRLILQLERLVPPEAD